MAKKKGLEKLRAEVDDVSKLVHQLSKKLSNELMDKYMEENSVSSWPASGIVSSSNELIGYWRSAVDWWEPEDDYCNE